MSDKTLRLWCLNMTATHCWSWNQAIVECLKHVCTRAQPAWRKLRSCLSLLVCLSACQCVNSCTLNGDSDTRWTKEENSVAWWCHLMEPRWPEPHWPPNSLSLSLYRCYFSLFTAVWLGCKCWCVFFFSHLIFFSMSCILVILSMYFWIHCCSFNVHSL